MTAGNILVNLLKDTKEPLGLNLHAASVLADWLEEAMVDPSRLKAGEIHDEIVQLYRHSLSQCSTEVQTAIRSNSNTDLKLSESYRMGILSLAQLIAAQSLDRKVSSEFSEILKNPANANYIMALGREPLSNKEIANKINQSEEHVSRKLKKLREYGVITSRKLGTTVINSLTATAKHVVAEEGLQNLID
jgi:DNA-binding transcriptional ArsR family regulator